MQFKNALDHSMTKVVQGSPVCMLCCSFECLKIPWAVECPMLPRVNAKVILTTNNHGKCNFIFFTAVAEGSLDSMKPQILLILRCVY